MISMLRKRNLLLLSFIVGFSVMVVELTAARIIAPILGSSIYTWTSAIGVILLGSLVGNYIGGRIIDKKNDVVVMASFLLLASVFILFILPIANLATSLILKIATLWLATLVASLTLFFVPAFLLGAVYPMIAKQFLQDITNMGKSSGMLSANWSAGSIAGTFLTGFVFTGYLGSAQTLLLVSIILFICSLWLYTSHKVKILSTLLYFVLASICFNVKGHEPVGLSTVFQKESNYYDIRVTDTKLPSLGKVRILFLDAGSHNIKSESNEKFDSYVNFYPAFSVFNKNIKDVAMIGGGSLEMSSDIKKYYPDANVTTAEIDPEVTKIAKKYFRASDYAVENTVPLDGRRFLAQSPKKYDAIFSDAYNSFISVPWHLATQDFFRLGRSRLNEDGVFAINFISSRVGDTSAFYESMLATFASVFENHYIFAYGEDPTSVENIVLVGINSNKHLTNGFVQARLLSVPGGEKIASHLVEDGVQTESALAPIIFTDNFAPTDRLMMPIVNKYFQPYVDFMRSGA